MISTIVGVALFFLTAWCTRESCQPKLVVSTAVVTFIYASSLKMCWNTILLNSLGLCNK